MNTAKTTLDVRLIRPEEFESLGSLTVAAYHSIPGEMPHQAAYDRQLRDVARRAATSCVLVAVTPAGDLLGGVTYVTGPEDPYSEDLQPGEAGMRMLAVDPDRHGRGAGRALVRACIARARAEGRQRLVLHTSEPMKAAIHLYESLGFEREPEKDFVPVPGVHLISYAMDLGKVAG